MSNLDPARLPELDEQLAKLAPVDRLRWAFETFGDRAGIGTSFQPAGVVIGLDRKERGNTDKSAIQEVEQQFGIPVVSIIDIDDILAYLGGKPDMKSLVEQIKEYRQEYGL